MITNVMFHKIAMNHVNTNLHTRHNAASHWCSHGQVTEQSMAPHNSISYPDENCDSAGVSQLLVTHLHL